MFEPNSDNYFTFAVGQAIRTWAMLESGVDGLVAVTFQKYERHPRHQEIPRALSRKITYLRDIAKCSQFEAISENLIAIADELSDLKERRHDVTHGVAYTEDSDFDIPLTRVLYEKVLHRIPEGRTTSLGEVADLTRRSISLASTVIDLATSLIDGAGEIADDPAS